jgi:hypothetical protein
VQSQDNSKMIGIICLALGVVLLAGILNFLEAKPFIDKFWPALLILIGVMLTGTNKIVGSALAWVGFLGLIISLDLFGTAGDVIVLILLAITGLAFISPKLATKPKNDQ